jgi:soluble lytic murein transglycosylase-like protein
MLAGLVAAALLAAHEWDLDEASAAALRRSPAVALPQQVGATESHWGFAQLQRAHHIFTYSRRYKISSDLAEAIYDAAIAEGIDPALAFPLVRLESRFNERATSKVGAIGLTQLMLPTARFYKPGVTREQLYERDLNLHVGFRYLRDLIRQHRGNIQIALLSYNRGPTAVSLDRELGIDPSNGYDKIVLRGYRGKGVLD